jgi:hypothetical protein
MVRPMMRPGLIERGGLEQVFEVLVGLDGLLDLAEGRKLGDLLGRIHRLGRILVFHLLHQQRQERVVIERRLLGCAVRGRTGGG